MTRTRIAILGAGGQIGGALASRLADIGEAIAIRRSEVDLAQAGSAAAFISRVRPGVIINAAAYTAVDRAETERDLAQRINAVAVAEIADAAKRIGAGLIHFSTDYVYDGTKRQPYVETDETNPLSEYGRTKLAGDDAIELSGVPHLIFRTSWVYSARGHNFRNAIVARAREKGKVFVVDDQIGAPTTTPAIAEAVSHVLEPLLVRPKAVADRLAPLSGVYHMSAAGQTTWYDFARKILERERIDAIVEPISTADFGAPARRPKYSTLDNGKLQRVFGIGLADWSVQLHSLGA